MEVLKFTLTQEKDRQAVEADIAVALFAAGCVFGKERVRLEANYAVAEDGGSCVLHASGEAGDAAARVFAGLTAERLGEGAYVVTRIEGNARGN